MIRNLKVLGLALGAVLALSAIAASSALAGTQGELTSDGAVKISGEDIGKSVLTFSATEKIECHSTYDSGKENETEEYAAGKFRHKIVPAPDLPLTTLTIIITSSHECVATKSGVPAPATVTMNGCDYLAHFSVTNGTGSRYGVTATTICPPGKVIEIHAYSSAAHSSSICTYTIPPQTTIGGSGFAESIAGGKITLGGTFTGITATRHKTVLCGNEHKEVNNATLTIDAVLEGKNEGGTATAISLSD